MTQSPGAQSVAPREDCHHQMKRQFRCWLTLAVVSSEGETLLNSSFIKLHPVSLESQMVSVGVSLGPTSLRPSLEFRLKMQEFTTVSRITAARSHSDTTSYKNLPQFKSKWSEWTAAQKQGHFRGLRHDEGIRLTWRPFSTSLKPSQKAVFTPWLAERRMSQTVSLIN